MLTAGSCSQYHIADVTLQNKYLRANTAWCTDARKKGRSQQSHPASLQPALNNLAAMKEGGRLWHGESCSPVWKAMDKSPDQSTKVSGIPSFPNSVCLPAGSTQGPSLVMMYLWEELVRTGPAFVSHSRRQNSSQRRDSSTTSFHHCC